MKIRLVLGALLVAALMGVGVLAGSVIGSASAAGPLAAQGTAPSAAASPTAVPSTNPNANPSTNPNKGTQPQWGGRGHGMRGGQGMGPGMGDKFGFGQGGFGFKGQGATADSATRAISSTTSLLSTVRGDLTYATGKMDTTAVQGWLNGATSLLQKAETANTAAQYEKAVGYARAADELAEVAETQMAQALGADKLPSYSQQGRHFNRPGLTNTNVTQAQASRILASTYQNIVMQGAVVKGSSEGAQYLTDAQNSYKTAYDAYNAGKYSDAVAAARVADQLAGVARELAEIGSLPSDPNAPVTVPAPNF